MSSYDDLPPDVKTAAVFMVLIYAYMAISTSYATYTFVIKYGSSWAGAATIISLILSYICLKCIDRISEHYINKEKKL